MAYLSWKRKESQQPGCVKTKQEARDPLPLVIQFLISISEIELEFLVVKLK